MNAGTQKDFAQNEMTSITWNQKKLKLYNMDRSIKLGESPGPFF